MPLFSLYAVGMEKTGGGIQLLLKMFGKMFYISLVFSHVASGEATMSGIVSFKLDHLNYTRKFPWVNESHTKLQN